MNYRFDRFLDERFFVANRGDQNIGGQSLVHMIYADTVTDSLESKKHRLRNNCAWAQRCMGVLSQPTRSWRLLKEPSGRCQTVIRCFTTPSRISSNFGNRPRSNVPRLTHSAKSYNSRRYTIRRGAREKGLGIPFSSKRFLT